MPSHRVVALLALSLVGCARPTPQASPPSRELVVAVAGDITGVYPAVRDESYTFAVLANVYEGLTRLGSDLRPEPAIAERWENPDERTWIFRLRAGLRFSDGRPLTVDDVVASLRSALAETATHHALAAIDAVEALPDGSVRIATRGPAPTLLLPLATAFVVPAADLSLPRDRWPAGSGPYAVEAWSPEHELTLKANPYRRGGAAPFSHVRLRVTPSAAERARALDAGEVDVADALSLSDVERSSRGSVRIVSRPGLRVLFLAFRMDDVPFVDARVRVAFDLAIDRDELITRALHGHGTAVGQVVPPSVAGFNPQLTPARADRPRARELLRASDPAARVVVLHGPSNRYVNDTEIMNEVARQLAEVGVQARVDARRKEEFFELLDAPETRFFLFGWSCDGADAGNALGSLFHTPNAAGLGFENSEHLSDPALDALVDAADQAPDAIRRQRLLAAGLARVAELHAVLPLLVQHESIGLGPRVSWNPPLDMALRFAGAVPVGDGPSPPR